MVNSTERFVAAYNYVCNFSDYEPIDLTKALEWDDYRMTKSIAASEGIHTYDTKRSTSKALGLICIYAEHNSAIGTHRMTIDRVELYRDTEGQVVPSFTERADIFVEISGGHNHGFPERELEIPPQSRELALNSALVAIEQPIDAHRTSMAI